MIDSVGMHAPRAKWQNPHCESQSGANPNMSIARTAAIVASIFLLVVAMFEIDLQVEMALPRETTQPDPLVEAEFARCYEQKDHEIHATAFGTIDNPDVQKEYISANRAKARRECRALHPQAMVMVRQPLRFKLFELSPRWW